MRVAYQGEPGSYSETAILERFGPKTEKAAQPTLDDVFSSVEANEVDCGLVPIENSIEGSICRTYDLLNERNLSIRGEHILRVVHCLLANKGVGIKQIKKVYSHPQALGQSRKYISKLGLEPVSWYDTAGSAKMVKEKALLDSAVIASRRAAEIYGLEILAEGIETHKNNFTRFIEIGLEDCQPTGVDKTTITLTVNDSLGSFAMILNSLADRYLRITKIESRPIIGKPWEYRFYVDYEGHRSDPASCEALKDIVKMATSFKVIGSYPRMKYGESKSSRT